jgi:hypothetical protein
MKPLTVNAFRVSTLSAAIGFFMRRIWYTHEDGLTAGEMAEWLKAHAWKACLPQGNVGSNPTLSAMLPISC